jgi:hypothetical protein
MGPLQSMLERSDSDRREIQRQADALRDRLHAADVDVAKAAGLVEVEKAKREAAERRTTELQGQVEALRVELAKPPPRPLWWPFRKG